MGEGMPVLLLRHGRTEGNLAGRYVGRTDEPILETERARLLSGREAFREKLFALFGSFGLDFPRCIGRVYTSPLRRSRETAALLFPEAAQAVIPAFREMDFGHFEYRNYQELMADPLSRELYQRYIDSMGESGFPGGESKAVFTERVRAGFAEAVKRHGSSPQPLLAVLHGGSIMALLDAFSEPPKPYFHWQCPCLSGFAGCLGKDGRIRGIQAIDFPAC